jgi:serine protease DegQ
MKQRLLLPAAAIAVVAGVAAGCAGSSNVTATPNGNATQLATPQVQTQTQTESATPTLSSSAAAVGDPYELIPDLVEQVQPSIVSVLVSSGQGGGQGSGVVWDGSRGIIVTNNHVVDGATEVQIVLSGGDELPAQVLATDAATDLAVIQVERTDLPQAEFAAELPRVGELAVAMGNPLGFENSVTAGIVSALHRSLGEEPFIDLIQTDAPISPGNSGGALVNRNGQIIGINSAGIPTTENANSLGFAIPSTTVIAIVNQLLADGSAGHAFLGISSGDANAGDGVVVETVTDGTAAATAGLQANDVITAIDGGEVRTTDELVSILRSHQPGDQVSLTVERAGQTLTLTVTLGSRTEPAA